MHHRAEEKPADDIRGAGKFAFLLKDGNGKVIEKAINDANGNIVFPDRTFSREASNYLYTIEEESGSLKGITYDRTIYTLKVTTTATGGQLKAKVDILKDNVPYDGSVRFVNVRKAPPTGDGTPGMVMLLSLMALGLAGTALYAGKRAGKRTN